MGIVHSVYDSNWPPKSKWSVNDMPDLTGKVVIITGGNTGIGKETAKELLSRNAKVYILSRDVTKSTTAIQSLKSETGRDAYYIQMDLGDLRSVRRAAEEFVRKESVLHILINNAAVMMPDIKSVTKEGHDLQFGVNVLGHYFLTVLLLPVLKAASSIPGSQRARVINVASASHMWCPGIKWDTLQDGEVRRKTPIFDLYNQSKFGNIVLTSELARRHGDSLVSVSVHPGLIFTELARHVSRPVALFTQLVSYKANRGALTSLYAATAPENANANGKYFVAWAREAEPDSKALDPEVGHKLWEWCEEQTKGF